MDEYSCWLHGFGLCACPPANYPDLSGHDGARWPSRMYRSISAMEPFLPQEKGKP